MNSFMMRPVERCDHGTRLWDGCEECKAEKLEFPWTAAGVTAAVPDIGEEYAGEYVTGDSGDESDFVAVGENLVIKDCTFFNTNPLAETIGDESDYKLPSGTGVGGFPKEIFATTPNLAELARIGKIAEAALSTKPTNPKDALGIKKVPFSTISMPVMAELGVAMLEGAMKYGKFNFRVIGVRASVYIDAAFRHLSSFHEGEDIDPDSGLSHVTKAIASLVVLRDAMINEKFTDDRPPRPPAGWMGRLNDAVSVLIKKYPNPVLPYTEVDNTWSEAAK